MAGIETVSRRAAFHNAIAKSRHQIGSFCCLPNFGFAKDYVKVEGICSMAFESRPYRIKREIICTLQEVP